jgi:hypothetical protein
MPISRILIDALRAPLLPLLKGEVGEVGEVGELQGA